MQTRSFHAFLQNCRECKKYIMYQPIAIVIQRCLKILFCFRGLESIRPVIIQPEHGSF